MKKIAITTLAILSVVACASMEPLPLDWNYMIKDPYQDHALNIIVTHVYQHFEGGFKGYQGGLEGIKVSFQNATSKPIVINWNKSALEYNGRSHRVFITGQKYIDAGKAVPDQVVVPGSQVDVGVYPADSIYFVSGTYGGWRKSGFWTDTISCLICVSIDAEERFYTANITIDAQ